MIRKADAIAKSIEKGGSKPELDKHEEDKGDEEAEFSAVLGTGGYKKTETTAEVLQVIAGTWLDTSSSGEGGGTVVEVEGTNVTRNSKNGPVRVLPDHLGWEEKDGWFCIKYGKAGRFCCWLQPPFKKMDVIEWTSPSTGKVVGSWKRHDGWDD